MHRFSSPFSAVQDPGEDETSTGNGVRTGVELNRRIKAGSGIWVLNRPERVWRRHLAQ